MLYVITGGPGAAKTLNAVATFVEWQKKDENKGRQFFTCNLNGANIPGAGILPKEEFPRWHELLPEGAVLLVDEGQEVMRPDSGRGTPPPHLTALEKHRHSGIDMIITTQHPSFIHTHVRKLATVHRHLIPLTNNSSTIFEWRECNDNPDFKRDTADMKQWLYPSEYYNYYVSATRHTKKLKMPPWLRKLVICAVIGIPLVIWIVYKFATMFYDATQESQGKHHPASKTELAAQAIARDAEGVRPQAPMTQEQYLKRFVPRVASMPWSAPAYDDRKPQTNPELYCVTIQSDNSETCRCYTEQATRYEVDAATCWHNVEFGSYNPFRAPPEDKDRRRGRQDADDLPTRPAAASPAIAPVAGISTGRDRATATPYTPPTFGAWNADAFGGSASHK